MIRQIIIRKVNNFIEDYVKDNSFASFFSFMVKYNVISIGIHDIFNGRKNKKRFIFSIINSMLLWLSFLFTISFLISTKLISLLENPKIPFDQLKQIIGVFSTVLFLVSNLKTDFLREEKRNNLIQLKFIYHLMINDQSNHKLNNRNYRILKIFARVCYFLMIEVGGIYGLPLIFVLFCVFLIVTKSSILIILSPLLLYTIFIYCTTSVGLLPLIYIILIYYIMRFNQINTQFLLFHKIQLISPRALTQTIDEHNQLSLSIRKLNSILNKSVASLFIITAFVIDLLIYLLIYTESLYYKIFFLYCFVVGFSVILMCIILIIKLSKSAHQSYNLLFSILQRKTLSYRMKFKVN